MIIGVLFPLTFFKFTIIELYIGIMYCHCYATYSDNTKIIVHSKWDRLALSSVVRLSFKRISPLLTLMLLVATLEKYRITQTS